MPYRQDDTESDLRYTARRRWNDEHRRQPPERSSESRRHGDPYADVFSRSLRDSPRTGDVAPRRREADEGYRFREDEIGGRWGYGSSWSDAAGLGEGVRYRGRRSGYGDPAYSGGHGSDRGRVTYALSGEEGGLDADDWIFGDRRHAAAARPGAFGGQKGGPSGGYGRRHLSGRHREQAGVPGAFGGRREVGRPDRSGLGPSRYVGSDERMREAVYDALRDASHLDVSDIEVGVERGEVTLHGTVPARAARRHAGDIADRVRGVRYVHNRLRIDATNDDARRLRDLP